MINHFRFLDLDSKLVCSTPFQNWKYYLNLNREDGQGEEKREREIQRASQN